MESLQGLCFKALINLACLLSIRFDCYAEDSDLWRDIFSPRSLEIFVYSVGGDSIDVLKESMLQNGPQSYKGLRYYAETEWEINWQWPLSDENKAIFEKTNLSVVYKIILPVYRPSAGGEELQKKWQLFFLNIVAHELQHAYHAAVARSEIQEILHHASTQDGAKAYAVNKEIKKVIQRARAKDLKIDSNDLPAGGL